mmetsp:Transcript_37882/g.74162  ORF Transcript_37882/g.74162 Transcript_37882/m.74162 type:complete len:219 (+) Transcript_37882:297-953(+)
MWHGFVPCDVPLPRAWASLAAVLLRELGWATAGAPWWRPAAVFSAARTASTPWGRRRRQVGHPSLRPGTVPSSARDCGTPPRENIPRRHRAAGGEAPVAGILLRDAGRGGAGGTARRGAPAVPRWRRSGTERAGRRPGGAPGVLPPQPLPVALRRPERARGGGARRWARPTSSPTWRARRPLPPSHYPPSPPVAAAALLSDLPRGAGRAPVTPRPTRP